MTTSFLGRWKLRGLALLAIGMLVLAPSAAHRAFAHPLGNFTTNRYVRIEVYRDRALVNYVVDMAEIPTFQTLDSIDANGDGTSSPEELAAYAQEMANTYPQKFALQVDGQPLKSTPIDSRAQLLPGQGGLDTLRFVAVYDVPFGAAHTGAQVAVAFQDENFTASQGWKEIVVQPSDGAIVNVDPALTVDRSDALLHYPAETLKSAPQTTSVQFTWTAGTGSTAPEAPNLQVAAAGRGASGFAAIFNRLSDGHVSIGFLLLSLLIAFAFGAQHALGPGHGKTMVAAYLVGSRGTPKHAVVLGLTVTATHTSTVYLLGFVTLVAAAWLSPESVYLWTGVAAGVMVMTFGLVLFAQRAISYRRGQAPSGVHRHGIFGKAHTHEPHEHHHEEEAHEEGTHAHPHPHEEPAGRVTWRSLLSLGVLGGLLPCPSAVVVMVAAISQGQVLLGMLLIVAFSLGLAGVLIAVGCSLVLGRKLPARQKRLFEHPLARRAIAVMPVVSAVIVTVVGLGLTYQAVGRV
jgi:ABC-type nickel/cobalt efflux system permease component RcnA